MLLACHYPLIDRCHTATNWFSLYLWCQQTTRQNETILPRVLSPSQYKDMSVISIVSEKNDHGARQVAGYTR